MPEEVKKKRGRPRKEIRPVSNENEKLITMTQANQENGNSNNDDKITLSVVQNRWANIFSKYASMGFDSISNAWAQSFSSLNNPFLQNARIKQINNHSIKVDSETLKHALDHPGASENLLGSVSMDLYYTNYIYNMLAKLNRDTPLYNYYVLPQYLEEDNLDKKSFLEESKRVDDIIKTFDPKLTFKTISTQVYLEGKSSYLIRTSYTKDKCNFFLLQKLNSDMVKLTGFGSKQQFIASFNMMIFLQPAYDVSQYPEYIRQVWEDMMGKGIVVQDELLKGGYKLNPNADIPATHTLEWTGEYYMYWVKLPQDLCYTFYQDGATAMVFPDTVGLFSDFNDLEDYKWLQASLLSKGINSVLTAQVPIIKNPGAGTDATVITPDTILGYQDFFMNNISGNILPFFAPFENFELHTLENQPESMDIIFDRTRDLIATSGNSALLSITDKPSIASVKSAQLVQASKCDYLTRQFERFLNNVINSDFELKYKWQVRLWGDIFYNRDDAKNLKELILNGAKGLIPKLLSSYGYTVEDYKSSTIYLDLLGITFEREAFNEDKDVTIEDSKVGRPKLNDDDILNDNTGISNDMGNNVSDIKEFSDNKKEFKEEFSKEEELITDFIK